MMTEFRARWIGWAAAALLGCCVPGWAQVQLGDQLALNLGGSVSGGYSGSQTNQGPSSNGLVFGGTANLSGYYHSPQFLSFDINPFYNQSRNDSNYQSITNSSGVNASTTMFGGSKYPAYVNYSDAYNSEGNFSVPGLGNYRTNGNGQTLGVGWSGNPTGLPSFSVGYQLGTTTIRSMGPMAKITPNISRFSRPRIIIWRDFVWAEDITTRTQATLCLRFFPRSLFHKPNRTAQRTTSICLATWHWTAVPGQITQGPPRDMMPWGLRIRRRLTW